MKNENQSRTILALLWVLVTLALLTGVIINVLIGNAITAQKEASEYANKHSMAVQTKINQAKVHFESTDVDILNSLNTDIVAAKSESINRYSKLLSLMKNVSDTTNVNAEHDGNLMMMRSIVEDVIKLKKNVILWRSKYDALAEDLSQGVTQKIARDILLEMRVKIVTTIGVQRIKAALKIQQYQNATDEFSDELAHQIVERHSSYVKEDLSYVLIIIADLERLIEVIANERNYGNLASLKDNQLYSSIERLQLGVLNFSDEHNNRSIMFVELVDLIEKLRVVVFGVGYKVDKQHETIIAGVGGLYNLHADVFQLQVENLEYRELLSELMKNFEVEADIFSATSREIEHVISRNVNEEFEATWRETVLFSVIGALLFLFVFFLISGIVRKQIDILISLKQSSEAANEAKSQFLASMSHEIRTPMNGVLGMAELLSFSELSEKQRHYVKRIQQSGVLLVTLINQVLDFSKVEAGEIVLESHDFNVEEILSELSELMQKQLQDKNIKLTINFAENNINVKGDSNRLRQILLNIIGNAIKFTENGSIIVDFEISHGDEGDILLRFLIKDTGIGIDQNALANVFEVFSQADSSTTRKYGGSGLGLSICKQLVELMGGRIGVSSRLGHGTTIDFTVKMNAGVATKLQSVPRRSAHKAANYS